MSLSRRVLAGIVLGTVTIVSGWALPAFSGLGPDLAYVMGWAPTPTPTYTSTPTPNSTPTPTSTPTATPTATPTFTATPTATPTPLPTPTSTPRPPTPIPTPSVSTQPDSAPLVVAFYYTWFDSGTWTLSNISDWPRDHYQSNDPNAVRRQVDQAKSAGIDAFVVSWLGPGNRTDNNFKMMLAVSSEKGFQVAIDFEADEYGGDPNRIVDALRYVRDQLMSHPFYLQHRGKKVLFFWRQQDLSVESWRWIRDQVDPNHSTLWIAEGVDVAYQQVFDGHHLYSIAWSNNLDYTYNSWRDRIRRFSAQNGVYRYWVATVMPGYNDRGTGRPDAFVRDREGGNFYRTSWREARESAPDWIVITSWNEWVEGSQIEPSGSYGDLYLGLTREYSQQFKAARHKAE